MRFVKPKADPSKTLAIILIGACMMLLVELFVLNGKSVICLGIADDSSFMQPELIAVLEVKAGRFVR